MENNCLDPVLVCSIGRCGGSALVHALASHPQMIACRTWPHEQKIAYLLGKVRELLSIRSDPGNIAAERETAPSLYKNAKSPFGDNEHEEEKLFSRNVMDSLDSFIITSCGKFYSDLAVLYGKCAPVYFVEKSSPKYITMQSRTFRTSRSLVLIRDPRDAIISVSRFMPSTHVYFDGSDSEDPIIRVAEGLYGHSWKMVADVIDEIKTSEISHKVLRYEEMVCDPEMIFNDVLAFLQLPGPDGLQACLSAFRESSKNRRHITAKSTGKSVGRWKKELSKKQQDQLHTLLGDVIARLGYEV